mmetsp:Transcript_9580/g.27420  ORF Transcript_9580/g.27420 Transcript_9580/m.27420 type:complete len:221 (-) Transcript_9580:2561-3223(-)
MMPQLDKDVPRGVDAEGAAPIPPGLMDPDNHLRHGGALALTGWAAAAAARVGVPCDGGAGPHRQGILAPKRAACLPPKQRNRQAVVEHKPREKVQCHGPCSAHNREGSNSHLHGSIRLSRVLGMVGVQGDLCECRHSEATDVDGLAPPIRACGELQRQLRHARPGAGVRLEGFLRLGGLPAQHAWPWAGGGLQRGGGAAAVPRGVKRGQVGEPLHAGVGG